MLEKQISKQAERDISKGTEIARCSAVFLSKHVDSLNQKSTFKRGSKLSLNREYFNSRNPSLSNNRIPPLDDLVANNAELLLNLNESTHHKWKYMVGREREKEFKPFDTIQRFMKKIEKREYYKDRIYDEDIYV